MNHLSLSLSSKGRGKQNNQKKKGNISILVIFVLLASGVIGVLTMHFVRQMLYYNGAINAYYKSYYLARAGLELSLTQVQNRGVGFEYSVETGDYIINDNFSCSPNCFIKTEIISQSAYHNQNSRYQTGCTDQNAFSLSGGSSLIFPLFTDIFASGNDVLASFQPTEYKTRFPIGMKISYIKEGPQADSFTLGMITDNPMFTTLSKNYRVDDATTAFDDFLGQNYVDERRPLTGNYLIVSNGNQGTDILHFCLDFSASNGFEYPIPLTQAHIKSIGSFQNKTLGLDAIYNHNVLPSFLSHTSLGF